jgi:hypothetical protein
MEKIIHKLINEFTEGVDTYTHNESTWLIFTETKQWVIELTENKTLWYNYTFFKSVFAYASLDCVQNQHLITKWVEDNVINKELTYVTLFRDARDRKQQFEDTLENGIKTTYWGETRTISVDNTLENGIKMTSSLESRDYTGDIDDVLEKGVNETLRGSYLNVGSVIQDGVKRTDNWLGRDISVIEDTIQNGVKNTKTAYMKTDWSINDTIENGVKHIYLSESSRSIGIKDTLKNGVKETKQKKNAHLVLDTSGRELILESHLVVRDGVRSSTPRQYVGGDIIDKIIDKGVIETHDDVYHHKGRIDGVIKNGVKETKPSGYSSMDKIGEVVTEGIKTKNPTD